MSLYFTLLIVNYKKKKNSLNINRLLFFGKISSQTQQLSFLMGAAIIVFCFLTLTLTHISKTILAMVMKFCDWIDLIKGECSAHEP